MDGDAALAQDQRRIPPPAIRQTKTGGEALQRADHHTRPTSLFLTEKDISRFRGRRGEFFFELCVQSYC